MAIRTNKVTVPETETPVQTETPETEVETQAQAQPEIPTPTPTPDPKPATKAPAGEAAIYAEKAPSFMELRNALDPNDYGNTFPRVVPGSGIIQTDSALMLGTYLDVQVLSFSDRWMYAPNVDMKKDPDSKYYCRASYDGKNIPDRDGGPSMTFEEYEAFAAELRTAGKKPPYTEWKLAKYMDVFAIIFNADPAKLEIAKALGMVQISVSSTAIKAFSGFFIQGLLNVNRGLLPLNKQNCMRIKAEPKINKDQNYTILVPELVPTDILANYTPVKPF